MRNILFLTTTPTVGGNGDTLISAAMEEAIALIDLKVGDLTHQDLRQIQMYVHYYERELMNEGDNPPIGIVLCADKSESVVKYTLPENETQIFASKYKLYLPSEEELLWELNVLI